jgi:hypothetical protein
MAESMA